MRRTGSIKGVIRDSRDRPLGEVAVMIVDGPPHNDIAALTGRDGSFAFGGLRPGSYSIQARGASATSDWVALQVRAGKVAFAEIWLEPNTADEPPRAYPADLEDPHGGWPALPPEDSVDEI